MWRHPRPRLVTSRQTPRGRQPRASTFHSSAGWASPHRSRSKPDSAKPDKGGALQTLAAQPGGRVLLWTITVGLATLVLWQLGEAAVGLRWVRPRNKRTRKRIESAVEAVVFGVLALSAGKLAAGGAGSTGQAQEAFTARALA